MRLFLWAMALILAAQTAPASAKSLPTVFLAEMTSPEVGRALQQGVRTIIIPTGGIEQGGPHLVLGKHNHIVRRAAAALARALGDALVAPVMAYVPEGPVDPPQGHMAFPGTISLPEPVFQSVLEAAARSFKAHGFRQILLLGDSGGNQRGQGRVAAKLSREWAGGGIGVLHISDYYDPEANGQFDWLRRNGLAAAAKSGHADLRDTSELLAAHAKGVRNDMIAKAGSDRGVTGNPKGASPVLGDRLLQLKFAAALAQVRRWRAGHE